MHPNANTVLGVLLVAQEQMTGTRSSSTEASHVRTKQEERGRQLRRPLLVYLAELLF